MPEMNQRFTCNDSTVAKAVLHCSKCWGERDTTGRYCRVCRAAYMRLTYRPRVKQSLRERENLLENILILCNTKA
jgi:predicted amidophosphoribosyltransferase